ncbi:MAG: urease accessory protein UreD [Oleiphilaceae bacterium]|nr:urease accessory protein UreD [Oleiphilaceae bacterium]
MNAAVHNPLDGLSSYGSDRAWEANLHLSYSLKSNRTIVSNMRFKGPLRVQRPFYPEQGRCHTYLLHPPGGMVSGDKIDISVDVNEGAESFITTPSAGKLYGADSENVVQTQNIELNVADNATLEFLPQENILFDRANGKLSTSINLSKSSKFIAWDMLSFGRPHGGYHFKSGSLDQLLQIKIDGKLVLHEGFKTDDDLTILSSPVGMMGHLHMGSLFIVVPEKIEHYAAWTEQARELLVNDETLRMAATQRNGVLMIRALSDDIEMLRNAFIKVWQGLRLAVLEQEPVMPRIWLT